MESHEVADLFDQAVVQLRRVVESGAPDAVDDLDDGAGLLRHAASAGAVALGLAVGKLADPDRVVRAAACDLLGVTSSLHEEVCAEAATALILLAANEADPEVHWSIARALGATCDARALPTLITLAGSPDSDVRFHVAVSVPAVLDDPPAEEGEAVLIDLCTDSDPNVREWATFGLGWVSSADGGAVRQALWDRAHDADPAVREEGVRGLARRRDRKALPLVRGLLAQDEVHRFTFQAAAYLADPSVLPLLEGFDPTADGVAEALRECDPTRRAQRDEAAWRLLNAIHLRRPDLQVAIFAERFDLGLFMDVTNGSTFSGHWFVDGLLKRAEGDPDRAAELAIAAVT
ncbi:HEAT repeat protein [Micromonospora luteifusca]|uniref:HEAT repeat protein n=1 Tax=Micromonospora luteifusca TaxID=709860 RepID=A0ABS2M0B9_9ACTN|nr:HEAT repeat domain-containing protein [Micromonospora luteifusca]MBM7493354.1 HEAT repeat protein [Micromonospora luteifusca]